MDVFGVPGVPGSGLGVVVLDTDFPDLTVPPLVLTWVLAVSIRTLFTFLYLMYVGQPLRGDSILGGGICGGHSLWGRAHGGGPC